MVSIWEDEHGFKITTDPDKINYDILFDYLHNHAYWCRGIPEELVISSLKHSLNFSVLSSKNEFIGFARIISDYATFAYLTDVFILDSFQGRGLGKFLMKCVMNEERLQGLRNWILLTADAHKLYEKFGWTNHKNPEKIMFNSTMKNRNYQ